LFSTSTSGSRRLTEPGASRFPGELLTRRHRPAEPSRLGVEVRLRPPVPHTLCEPLPALRILVLDPRSRQEQSPRFCCSDGDKDHPPETAAVSAEFPHERRLGFQRNPGILRSLGAGTAICLPPVRVIRDACSRGTRRGPDVGHCFEHGNRQPELCDGAPDLPPGHRPASADRCAGRMSVVSPFADRCGRPTLPHFLRNSRTGPSLPEPSDGRSPENPSRRLRRRADSPPEASRQVLEPGVVRHPGQSGISRESGSAPLRQECG
jgi:hypothetical protein